MTPHSSTSSEDRAQEDRPTATRRRVVRTAAGGALTATGASQVGAAQSDLPSTDDEDEADAGEVEPLLSPVVQELWLHPVRDVVGPGQTVEVDLDLQLSSLWNLLGVGLEVAVDPNVARITDASLAFSLETVDVAADGSAASLVGTDIADDFDQFEYGSIGTLELEGVEAGETEITASIYEHGVQVGPVDDPLEEPEVLEIDTTPGELTVRSDCLAIGDRTACAVGDDGELLRDFTGDGEVGTEDVSAFQRHLFTDDVQNRTERFDFSDNGDVSHGDVIALFREATGL